MIKIEKVETLITAYSSPGEVAEIALHLNLNSSGGEVFIICEELTEQQREWMFNKTGIIGEKKGISILLMARMEKDND